jgi:hypothetical protein
MGYVRRGGSEKGKGKQRKGDGKEAEKEENGGLNRLATSARNPIQKLRG